MAAIQMRARLCVAFILLGVAGATHSADAAKVPMPPTNLRVDFSPTAEMVNRIFSKEGIPPDVRAVIYSSLKELEKGDLMALVKGISPDQFGLMQPAEITVDQWNRLTSAYAEAMLSDREAQREFHQQIGLAVLSAGLGLAAGVWLGRITAPSSAAPATTTSTPTTAPQPSNANGNRKRKRRRGR